MTTTTLTPQIAAFAAAVRTALADLPPEELDDLTDGLEADLAERAADGGPAAAAELGDPAAYAEELRAAAGYPPRAARSHLGQTLPNIRRFPQDVLREWTAFRASHPRVDAVVAFLVTLRPVWWVLRGLIAYGIFAAVFGTNTALGWLVAIALVVVSVQWGRGKWLPKRWMRGALLAANIVLIIAVPFVLAWAFNSINNAAYDTYSEDMQPVSTSNSALTDAHGNQVTNIFAYDAQGNPIPQVQLFDQDGKPLNLVGDTSLTYSDVMPFADESGGYVLVPNGDVPGRAGWNVYPLGQVDYADIEGTGELPSNVQVTAPKTPFDFVKPLSGSEPATASTASPTQAPTPSPAG